MELENIINEKIPGYEYKDQMFSHMRTQASNFYTCTFIYVRMKEYRDHNTSKGPISEKIEKGTQGS